MLNLEIGKFLILERRIKIVHIWQGNFHVFFFSVKPNDTSFFKFWWEDAHPDAYNLFTDKLKPWCWGKVRLLMGKKWEKRFGLQHQVFPGGHPSTNLAQCCLTSVIRRELVHSGWYGRWRRKWPNWGFKYDFKLLWRQKLWAKRKVKECHQHTVFPGGHPSKY